MLELVLHSPANGDPCVYYWPIDEKAKGEGAVEIIETIKWVCDDFPEMKLALDNCILSGCDVKSYESMKIVCDRYNRVIDSVRQMRAGTSLPVAVPTRPSPGLLRHIIQKAYNHAVTEPDKLNNYEPFSPEVYGETSYEFISQMIDQIPITENDVFIDLGSGVGQVVLQVAASTKAKKCIGIERAEVPAIYAHELEKSFQFWMRWYGKIYGDYELIKGDFFEEKHKELITNASFIFVNNFAFGPNVDHMLKLRFADLRDGARIVSSKSFCPLNFRITDRNLSDIATIMHVREIQPNIKGSVSWTGKPVSYYHHIIDRRKLEDYFLNMRGAKKHNNHQNNSNNNNNNNNANANANANANNNKDSANNVNNTTNTNINHHNKYNEESDHLRPAKVNNSNTNSNDSSSSDDSKDEKIKDENYFGPTTRKAWSEWCNSRYRDNSNSNSNQSSNGNTQLTSSSETGYHSESQVKSHANGTNRPGRPRKYSPGVSAVVRRATKNKANSSGRRRPGRPRKDGMKISKKPKKAVNFNGLDLLHAQTVLSISNSAGVRTEPAPGCIDQKLDSVKRSEVPPQSDANKSYGLGFGQMRNSIMDAVKSFDSNNANVKPTLTDIDTKSNTLKPTDTSLSEASIDKKDYPKQEKAIVDYKIEESENKPLNTAHSFEDYQYLMESVSSSLDVLFEDYKRQYMSLLLYMQTPKYKNELVAEVDMEKRKHSNLLAQVDLLERTVNNLRDKGVNLLKTRLGELDIVASTSEELVTRAKEIVCRNKELQEQVYMYQEQVNYLDNLNNALKKHKSYDTLINVNQIKAQNEPQVMQPVNVVLAKPPSTSETVNRTEINASEQVDQNSMVKPNDNQLRQQVQQNSVQTPLPNDYQCNSNNTLDSCRLINIEERMKKMIVAALNDKAGANQPSKPVKKESRKRSSTKTSNLKAAKAASRCDGVYDFEEDEPPSVRPETDYPSRLKDSSKLGPIKDVSITASTTGQSTKATDARSTNKATNASNNLPNEDKKPILLTFKIDRRDNSAIVTSPAISPEKSPSKSPKDTEVHIKRKHLSPERVKKSRSPKYSSIVPETNGSEKRTSLIIKLNHSSIHITSNHNHEKSESSINRDSNLKTDKPLDGSNKPLTTTVPSNRSHHGPANGSHKWQATISNSFDKLVKLAHQLDPPKEELPPTMVVEKSILKATLKRKRSQKPSDSQKVKQSFYAFEESSTAKTPPDTPPQTPSPSDSLERPLTPQTPPGLTPASDGMTSINQHNHGSKETKSLPSSINSRSRVEPTPVALQENGSTSDQTTTNLKVRKVGRPPKKSMPIMWNKSVEQANNSTMNNSALNLINFANQADRLNDSSLKSSMNHESYNKHSINEPKGETNNSMNVQITALPHYHHQQALFNHQFMQTNKSMDLHMNKNNQNSMKFTSPMNGDYSPLSVPISSIAQHQVQNGYGSSLDFSPQAFHPSFSPPDNNYNKLHRKLSLDESSTSSSLSKCYSQKKLLRPSRLDAVCKRDYNTAIKQYT